MTQPIRAQDVLFVTRGYHPQSRGGAENQAQLQAEALVRLGHRVTVVCPASAPGERATRHNGVSIVRLRAPSLPRPLGRIAYAVRLLAWVAQYARCFSLVHVHALRLESNFVIPLVRLMGRPVYLKLTSSGARGEWASWRGDWRRFLLMARFATRIQALTGELAGQLVASGVARDRVVCIPNGIDLVRFRPASVAGKAQARRELGLPSEGVVVLYCGTFQPIKGTPELLAAWERLTPVAATLVLVGQAASGYRLPAARGVVVMPWQDDIAPYYRAADVFVLPSRAEGMSNALLEALASGLAVIATRVGAAETLIADPEQGLLVPPADIEALATALREVIDDPGLRAKLMKHGPSAVQHLAIDAVVETIEAAYIDMQRGGAAGESARQTSYRKH